MKTIQAYNEFKKNSSKNYIQAFTYKPYEGLSDNLTPEDIAKKHNVSVDQINNQIQKGIKVEREHTKDKELMKRIAMDHLMEYPDYYDRLEKVEQ